MIADMSEIPLTFLQIKNVGDVHQDGRWQNVSEREIIAEMRVEKEVIENVGEQQQNGDQDGESKPIGMSAGIGR